MSRLPRLSPAGLDDDQRALYDAITTGPRAGGPFPLTGTGGALTGPFNAMLFAPPAGQALQRLGAAMRYETVLGARIRELAILAVAAHHECDFERYAHTPAARAAGATDAHLAAVAALSVPDDLDGIESAALRLVLALLADGDLDDVTYAELVPIIGNRVAVELTTLVGYYTTLALQLRVFRVPLPAEQP
ncbi:carboxymuconolactone decarboxylase family protein [Amycolatopsis magusensis]|uniref:carboxymuconolactone decarboxylase family protein n=1 Tax=Amycolatopsis magusensis TaxID=882444 RepID=UPI00379B4949